MTHSRRRRNIKYLSKELVINRIKQLFIMLAVGLMILACKETYTPKPEGYPKVEYPQKSYVRFDTNAPFSFEYPEYAKLEPDTSANAEPYWYNIIFPELNGTIYLSYKEVNNNLLDYIEDSRTWVYKHTIKAEAIDENLIYDTLRNVYGILYDLKGNTASSLQFFITDSTKHFLRGALYFNTQPNADSLSPVIQFIREDVKHLIQTNRWKN